MLTVEVFQLKYSKSICLLTYIDVTDRREVLRVEQWFLKITFTYSYSKPSLIRNNLGGGYPDQWSER
jgi:hypothetical protein